MSEPKSESELETLLSGKQQIHRLKSWEDGDVLYGVAFFNRTYDGRTGKTFSEEEYGTSGEQKAREMFQQGGLGNSEDTDEVLYKAIVRTPETDPPNPSDPGEPPLKHAHLEEVEILDRKPPA